MLARAATAEAQATFEPDEAAGLLAGLSAFFSLELPDVSPDEPEVPDLSPDEPELPEVPDFFVSVPFDEAAEDSDPLRSARLSVR
jgi:hypothetical protein